MTVITTRQIDEDPINYPPAVEPIITATPAISTALPPATTSTIAPSTLATAVPLYDISAIAVPLPASPSSADQNPPLYPALPPSTASTLAPSTITIAVPSEPSNHLLLNTKLRAIEQEIERRKGDIEKKLGHPLTIEQTIMLCGLLSHNESGSREKKIGLIDSHSGLGEDRIFFTKNLHSEIAQLLFRTYSSQNMEKEKAHFEKTGFFLLQTFSEAMALQNLSTKNNLFRPSYNFLQEKLTRIFGSSEQIQERLTALKGQMETALAPEQSALISSQIKTLEWALSMVSAEATAFTFPPVVFESKTPSLAAEMRAPRAPPAETMPLGITTPRVIALAPMLSPAHIAPITGSASSAAASTGLPRQIIQVRATDSLEIDTSHPDWFKKLPREQRLCLLANLVLKIYGKNEALVADHFLTEGIDATRTLTSLERHLPTDENIQAAAQRILASYALRDHVWNHKEIMDKIRESGIASEEAFLQHMYTQANEELYIGRDEIPEGVRHEPTAQRAWAETHWHRDAFDGSAPSEIRDRHRENVFQALERFIMAKGH